MARHPAGLSIYRGIVIVPPQQVEHHRWAPDDPDSPEHGLTPLDASTRALLRRMRWRKLPRERRQVWPALIVALLLHALFALAIWHAMRPSLRLEAKRAQHEVAMEIRFIEPLRAPPVATPPPALPTPPPPVVARRAPPPPPRVHEAPARDAMTLQTPPAPPVPATPSLYDQNGQPVLPSASSAPSAPAPGYVQRMPQGDTQVMSHDNPIKYQSTRFEKDWDKGGNPVDQALQKVVDKTTLKKTIKLPGGIRIHCAIGLLAGGCRGDPPAPPSKKDGDERLSMAPAKSLAPDPHPSTPPSLADCIAMYRAGQPLAWGCPVDTPNRAIDEETRERSAAERGQH
jgi:hypothetical protein